MSAQADRRDRVEWLLRQRCLACRVVAPSPIKRGRNGVPYWRCRACGTAQPPDLPSLADSPE